MPATFIVIAAASVLPIFPLIVFGMIAAFVILGIVINSIAEKKRAQAWEALAVGLGFSYEKSNTEIHQQYPFKLFNRGRSQECRNLLTGAAAGTSIILADYQYTVRDVQNSAIRRITICIAESKNLNLPPFYLRPEQFYDRLRAAVGAEDFDFDEDPEFSENYVLQGENEEAVRGLFNDSTRELFIEHLEDAPHVEGNGDVILLHLSKRVAPEDSAKLMEFAFELMKLWAQ